MVRLGYLALFRSPVIEWVRATTVGWLGEMRMICVRLVVLRTVMPQVTRTGTWVSCRVVLLVADVARSSRCIVTLTLKFGLMMC